MELIAEVWHQIAVRPMINLLVFLYWLLFPSFTIAIVAFALIVQGIFVPVRINRIRLRQAAAVLRLMLREFQKEYRGNGQHTKHEMPKTGAARPVDAVDNYLFVELPICILLCFALWRFGNSATEGTNQISRDLYGWLPQLDSVTPVDSSFFSTDLANPDLFLMPLLAFLTLLAVQALTMLPTHQVWASAKSLQFWAVPVFIGGLAVFLPSGVALYWVVSWTIRIVVSGLAAASDPFVRPPNFPISTDRCDKDPRRLGVLGYTSPKSDRPTMVCQGRANNPNPPPNWRCG